jgi:hypothetical protein
MSLAMRDPRTMILDVDHSGLHDEPGSRGWIITRRSMMVACLSDIRNNLDVGRSVFQQMREYGGWEHLRDLKGRAFRSFEEFCESPNGLGMRRERIEERLTAQELAQSDDVAPLAKRGRPAKGQEEPGEKGSIRTISRGETAAYLVAKLKRDRPDIAKRLAAGEFRSARAAALAAGIIEPTAELTKLLRAWKRASPAERDAFLAKVTQ